ncbi:MAG TPA: zinc ABC transporter substrate-binding protein [Candidatus Brocadiia bacterium]|nr:zinc ABC transporter substrate-binding protein [Candidatus Brocadiia bacterium]
MMKSALIVICAAILTALPVPAAEGAGAIPVFVSIPPQAQFAKKVGGARVSVSVLVGPGQNPHVFEPKPQQIAALGKARLYFTVGVPFERTLVERISKSMPGLKITPTDRGIKKLAMTECDHHEEGSHEEHEADEEGLDPHVWLAPLLIKVQAKNMADALIESDPANAAEYRKNLEIFGNELDELHARIAKTLAPHKGQAFYVFHPAFGYFADAYGLRQKAVEAGGRQPTPKQLSALIKQAREDGAKVVFVQPQFDKRSAETIAQAIGGAVVPLDSLAEDATGNLELMADQIAKTMDKGK